MSTSMVTAEYRGRVGVGRKNLTVRYTVRARGQGLPRDDPTPASMCVRYTVPEPREPTSTRASWNVP